MAQHISWIKYRGCDILFVDYAGLKDEATYLAATNEFEAEVMKLPPGRKIRTVVDVSDSLLNSRISDRNKEIMKLARSRGLPDGPTAIIGPTGFKMAVVNALSVIRPGIHVSSTLEEAEEWVIAQSID